MKLRQSDVSWQELDGEVIVLDLAGSVYLRVNGSGTLLWNALADGAERSALVDLLMQTYGIDQQRAETDVDAFLAELRSANLLENA